MVGEPVRAWRKRREISSSVKPAWLGKGNKFDKWKNRRHVRFSISSRFFKFFPVLHSHCHKDFSKIVRLSIKAKAQTHGETATFVHKRKQFLNFQVGPCFVSRTIARKSALVWNHDTEENCKKGEKEKKKKMIEEEESVG